jgi:hypothetical protein
MRRGHPTLIIGVAGGTFFLIGGAATAIGAIVLASLSAMAAEILRVPSTRRPGSSESAAP